MYNEKRKIKDIKLVTFEVQKDTYMKFKKIVRNEEGKRIGFVLKEFMENYIREKEKEKLRKEA